MAQEHHIIRVRGLPFSCNEEDVKEFFSKCNIQEIHFTKNRDGRPSGDAYIEMCSLRDVKEGLKYDRKEMGSRYLEVFEARYSEMEWMLNKNSNPNSKSSGDSSDFVSAFELFYSQFITFPKLQNPESDFILRLRGLPFEAGAPEIIQFFEGKYSSPQGVPISVSCHDYYYSQSSFMFRLI